MREFDASSIVHAWDNYPIITFRPLWQWIGEKFQSGEFGICKVALKEVSEVSDECAKWLKGVGLGVLPIGSAETMEAYLMAKRLGIEEDDYHADGVDEKDLLIIASAKVRGHELVSNESVQNDLPKNIKRYKIPAVCKLAGVPCMDFVELLRKEKPDLG